MLVLALVNVSLRLVTLEHIPILVLSYYYPYYRTITCSLFMPRYYRNSHFIFYILYLHAMNFLLVERSGAETLLRKFNYVVYKKTDLAIYGVIKLLQPNGIYD